MRAPSKKGHALVNKNYNACEQFAANAHGAQEGFVRDCRVASAGQIAEIIPMSKPVVLVADDDPVHLTLLFEMSFQGSERKNCYG